MSSELENRELEQRVIAAERLLSTLIAILSARDSTLLDELEGVFAKSDFSGDEAGRAATDAWKRIASALDATRTLVNTLGDGVET